MQAGVHVEGDKEFRTGDVVESQMDLATLFPGKFVRVQREKLSQKENDWDDEAWEQFEKR